MTVLKLTGIRMIFLNITTTGMKAFTLLDTETIALILKDIEINRNNSSELVLVNFRTLE